MTGSCLRKLPVVTTPSFQLQANGNAVQMASYSWEKLGKLLHVNADIARENWLRYQHFFDEKEEKVPAVFSYDGMVFQRLAPESFTDEELRYANSHLLIGSFLYGLLRPLDLIKKYRMEGKVCLPENEGKNLFDYWKPLLTNYFIEQIKADDGMLVNLSSDELTNIFDWKKIQREVKVISPQFRVMKEGELKTIVIYTKMCRGAMTRYILKNRPVKSEELEAFEYEGFRWNGEAGSYEYDLIP
jgi:cytoplasmic iron level regulating protein YaaA (DUF328/UPF0246 family)